mmetsp:Transcript_35738/g.86328  ORF Transcript_35738/g.86328 Transcript_35738/m.86328 type:complete len:675 (+) Transcript_35738:167-2191(+)
MYSSNKDGEDENENNNVEAVVIHGDGDDGEGSKVGIDNVCGGGDVHDHDVDDKKKMIMMKHRQLQDEPQSSSEQANHTNNNNIAADTTDAAVTTNEEESSPSNNNEPPPLLEMIGPAYARRTQFWKLLLFSSTIQGVVLSLIALAYFLGFNGLAAVTWRNESYETAMKYSPYVSSEGDNDDDGNKDEVVDVNDVFGLGNGSWWYVGLLSLTGFCVGLIKVAWSVVMPNHKFPIHPPGLVDELKVLKSDDIPVAIPYMACAIISIGGGAVVGPEAALGTMGSSVGSILGRRWSIPNTIRAKKYDTTSSVPVDDGSRNKANDHPEEEQSDPSSSLSSTPIKETNLLPDLTSNVQSCCFDGMSAAFGPLFPAQYLSPMLLVELAVNYHLFSPTKLNFMETVTSSGFASSFSYVIFTSLKGRTFLKQIPLTIAGYETFVVTGEIDEIGKYVGYCVLLGVVCGCVGFLGFLCMGIGKKIGSKIFMKIQGSNSNPSSAEAGQAERGHNRFQYVAFLLTPTLGGALVGLLAVASPLILSDGSDQIETVINNAETLGIANLLVTMLLKLIAVGMSLGFGFIGGNIFPFIFAGTCLGSAAHLIFPDQLPFLIAIGSCMVAVPCAFLPSIFSLTTLASMTLVLGGAATTPIFVACFCSYTTVCGLGLVQDLVNPPPTPKKQTNK